MRRAVLAGSFDPITLGHLDVLARGCELFDEVVLACGNNPKKRYLLSLDERLSVLHQVTSELPGVTVDSFDGLLVDYCMRIEASVILRGLRAVTDFEFEFQIGLANRDMAPDIETVFLLAAPRHVFVSRSLGKEIHTNGGDVTRYVPPAALAAMEAAYARRP